MFPERDSRYHMTSERSNSGFQVVDLCSVAPAELDDLWQHEVGLWRDRLRWDRSGIFTACRRALERGGLPGKVVRVGDQAIGYAYYVIAGRLGVISGLAVSPVWSTTTAGEALLKATIDDLRSQGVRRLESPFVSFDCPWLVPMFERQGFRTYWREFLRLELRRPQGPANPPTTVQFEPWGRAHLEEAARVMQAAYDGGVDAEIYELYRSLDGCRIVLDNILHQGGCGIPVGEASALARQRGRRVGFVLVTEIAPRHGHLVQVAVHPEFQRQGIGRNLVEYSLWRLADLPFDSLSLIVSRSNDRALRLYRAMHFQPVLAFPVFTWEQ
jgi:ribosomal protein S18 acetylase RimI-like enzyme